VIIKVSDIEYVMFINGKPRVVFYKHVGLINCSFEPECLFKVEVVSFLCFYNCREIKGSLTTVGGRTENEFCKLLSTKFIIFLKFKVEPFEMKLSKSCFKCTIMCCFNEAVSMRLKVTACSFTVRLN
jgi:hypothetical protein